MNPNPTPENSLPQAHVKPSHSPWWIAVLPVVALGISSLMVYSSLQESGLEIMVHAEEGHGLRVGASLRYRGIQVGTVEKVLLEADMDGVQMLVRLDDDARDLAREGSQFWIVYPRVGLDGIQGIETVIGARYLAVAPSSSAQRGVRQSDFTARTQAPVEDSLAEGGLDIVLDAPSRFGLQAGAPVTYRGFWIGRVVSVALASDATVVEVRCRISRDYKSLVRENSVFWEESGIEMDLSLSGGITLDVGTLQSMLMGAVAMATPTYPGKSVSSGRRFALVAGAEDEWLQWRPAVPIGRGALPLGLAPPVPLEGKLSWRKGNILRFATSHRAWLLPLEGGLVGPAEFFELPESYKEDSLVFLAADKQLNTLPPVRVVGELGICDWDDAEGRGWPKNRMRNLEQPEDCMVYAGPDLAPQSVAAYRMLRTPRGMEVSEDVRFSAEWHGAPVVARSDGHLIGVLLLVEGNAHIAPIPLD
ncbi:MAG: MCE family protein [Planctomycetes bacterium]|nr:MCE family protein [Planctomycetota bacterium]